MRVVPNKFKSRAFKRDSVLSIGDSRSRLRHSPGWTQSRGDLSNWRNIALRARINHRVSIMPDDLVDIDLEAVTADEAQRLRNQGVQLPAVKASVDPRTRADYIDNRLTAVGFSIYLGVARQRSCIS